MKAMSARDDLLATPDAVIYREVQRFLQPVVLVGVFAGVLGVVLAVVALSTATGSGGSRGPAVTLIVAVALAVFVPAVLLGSRLVTEVSAAGLRVRLAPFQPHGRREPWTRVAAFAVVTYRPVRDYGGWGIRGTGRRVAYNARGDRGVLFTFDDGATLLVGSQQPEALAAAAARASGGSPSPPPREAR